MVTFHPIYSKAATIYLVTGQDKFDAMRRALEASHFFEDVEAALEKSGKSRHEFFIAVKPNIMTAAVREEQSPVYTDPGLVEYVFDQLRERGFQEFAILMSTSPGPHNTNATLRPAQ